MPLTTPNLATTYSSHLGIANFWGLELSGSHKVGMLGTALPLVADFDIQKALTELASVIQSTEVEVLYKTKENALYFIEQLGSLTKKVDLSVNASGYIDFSWQKDRDNMCLVTVLPTGELACSAYIDGNPESFIADLSNFDSRTATFRLYGIISRIS